MAFTDSDRLRRKIGEVIPADGTASDTMFSVEQITDILTEAGGDLNRAAWLGWQQKAAEYANLVTVSEGNSQRNMSDLYKQAMAMVKHYRDVMDNGMGDPDLEGRRGRVHIGVIRRSY